MTTQSTGRELNIQTVEHAGLRWVNIVQPTLAEMEFLKDHYPFHPLDLDDCLSRLQLPKLDEYPEYLFLVLHFPRFNHQRRITQASQVSIFVGADYVVTVHAGDLRPLTKLFRDVVANEETRQGLMTQGSGYLLYRMLDGLVDYCFPILNRIIQNVNGLEEQILELGPRRTAEELSVQRRDIIAYRRIIRPQIEALESLEQREYAFLRGADQEVYFGDLADHTRRIWVELEELKEVIEGLQDTHSALGAYHTNEVMRLLTIMATIMLPLSVVSGLYGMNVTLPLEGSPYAFLAVLGVMAAITGTMLVFFRLRHWL